MGSVKNFEQEKLIIGIMYTNPTHYQIAIKILIDIFGEIDVVSDEYIFSNYSNYYNKEMNGIVLRRFVSFYNCQDPASLADIKLKTNDIERKLADNGQRIINLDPCLLSHGKFIMATTKSASFRIPLNYGIYAELSLVYTKGTWAHFYWTYFDIKTDFFKGYLCKVRSVYLEQRKVWRV